MKRLIFYYDIICPYAYLASKLVADLAQRNSVQLLWRPVLLGGIYKLAVPTERKDEDQRVITRMPEAKKQVMANELQLLYRQRGLNVSPYHVVPDIRTLNAMRLLASIPDETGPTIERLSHALFDGLWRDGRDVADISVLQDIANEQGMGGDVGSIVKGNSTQSKEKLIANTQEAVDRGAFGVPTFVYEDRIHFGVDRMHFLERALGNVEARPHRAQLHANEADVTRKRKLTFYFDFASPWAYIGFKQLRAFLDSLAPVQVDLELVPLLLGGLFRAIGTPDVPLRFAGENKLRYGMNDLQDWLAYHRLDHKFRWSSHFPIRSILPLRATLAGGTTFELAETMFNAAWEQDKDIGDADVLRDVLTGAQHPDVDGLLQHASSSEVKLKLRENTDRAVQTGLCGVPSFQVDGGELVIWGQDKMNLVADLLMGWEGEQKKSKL